MDRKALSVMLSRFLTMYLALGASSLFAASPVTFPANTTFVTLDGQPVQGGDSLRYTMVYDESNGRYHLWSIGTSRRMAGITHAVSDDGVAFTSAGTVSVPPGWWVGGGATVEPPATFVRADKAGNDWYLTVWTENGTGYGPFTYNNAVWKIAANADGSPGNAAMLLGPIPAQPAGPGATATASFGMVDGQLYLKTDEAPKGLGRWGITLSSPPAVTPANPAGSASADLFAGTGYDAATTYVHQVGRVAAQGGTALGAYYDIRNNDGTKTGQKIWYVESTDDGVNWSAPVDGFNGTGAAVTVNGTTNNGYFSHAEVTGNDKFYFASSVGSCTDASGTGGTLLTAPLPVLSAAFSPSTVSVGDTTTLILTLRAPPMAALCGTTAPATLMTNAGYQGTLPSGVVLAGTPALAGCAAGTASGSAGDSAFAVSGWSAAPGTSCTLTVPVRVTSSQSGRLQTPIVQPAGFTNTENLPLLLGTVGTLNAGMGTIAVSKTTTATTPGTSIAYTLTVSNVDNTYAANSVIISDMSTADLMVASWNCVASNGATCPALSGSGDLNETVATLPAGGVLTYTLTANVIGTPVSVTNTLSVDPGSGLCASGNPAPCTASAVVPPVGVIGVTMTTVGQTGAEAGGTVTYNVTVSNAGSVPAHQVAVSAPLPPGAVSGTWRCLSSAVCGSASGSLPLNDMIASLPAGASATYQVTAVVAGSGLPSSIIGTASATLGGEGVCTGGVTPPCNGTPLAFPVRAGAASQQAIPLLSPWALMCLAGLLGGSLVLTTRHGRRR